MIDVGLSKDLAERAAQVLVVDDDELVRESICNFLTDCGYKVTQVADGVQALAVVREQPPDIILMDAAMPEMDGFEATRVIKKDMGLEHVPVLMITAHTNDEYIERAFEAGASDFITKPVHRQVLRYRLNYLWQSIQKNEISRLAGLVMENTNQGIIITDSELKILVCNRAFSEITGYSEEEAVGQTPGLLR